MKDIISTRNLLVAALLWSCSSMAAVRSNETPVQRQADSYALWHTIVGNSAELRWSASAEGLATLTVRAPGYSQTTEVSGESYRLTLPAATSPETEQVFELTLTFTDGSRQQAILGVVASVSGGNAAETVCQEETGDKWGRFRRRAVIPVTGATIDLNGERRETGLGFGRGWYELDVRSTEKNVLLVNGDDEADLVNLGTGFVLTVR